MDIPQMVKRFRSSAFWPTQPQQRWFRSAFLLSLCADQFTKYVAFAGRFGVLNRGVSLSLLPSVWWGVVTVGVLALVWWRCSGMMMQRIDLAVAWGIFLGAAVSNVIDRVLFGGVRDWIGVPFLGVQNNLADWMMVGALVFFVISPICKKLLLVSLLK